MDNNSFEEKVFEVLRNYIEYKQYSGNTSKAVTIIHKSFPNRPKEEISTYFDQCIKAYNEAILLVKDNISFYKNANRNILKEEAEFRVKHFYISKLLIDWMIGWIYHWHHER